MQKILWCVQKNRNTASERHELFYIVCVCVCLDKCSQSALKCSFPGMVCCKASVVGGQFRGLSPFLFLLSPSGTSFAVGSAKLCSALLCSTCRVPFAATQIKSRGFGTSLRQLFFFQEQPSKDITALSAIPGNQAAFLSPFALCAASCSFHILLSFVF